ncbi:hypothetical protein C6T53_06080 [Burkholderia multivorans]|nr:hypothetical protein C6T53_06080 [Burkholderia multivorans]
MSTAVAASTAPVAASVALSDTEVSGAVATGSAASVATSAEVSGIPCVRRVEIQIPMLNRSG